MTAPSELSKTVLKALGRWKLPVDPFAIIADEGIELAAGIYGEGFDARIEYLHSVKRFVIYYRTPGGSVTEGRVRFSVAHELGHFYLPQHREQLIKGKVHNSKPDFRSRDPHENEADEFAASLLMPEELFRTEIRRCGRQSSTLKDLCRLADRQFHTSITSTARRYCEYDFEACSIVLSENERVKWAMHSDGMREKNMRYIPFGDPVAAPSKTGELWKQIKVGSPEPVEGFVDPEVWFERPFYRNRLWEEAMALGNTGVVLTFLTLEEED